MSDINHTLTPEELREENEYLKWKEKDTLRSMTSKYNNAVDRFHERIEQLEDTADEVNEATNRRFEELDTSLGEKFEEVSEKLSKKIESVSKEDVGLGKVDNTSDSEKPVSTKQQQAIKDAVSEFLTSEETGEEITDGDNPEISAPIKEYIKERVQEMGASIGKADYGVATDTMLGVVKASDDVKVDPHSGKMSIPKLATHEEEFQAVKESLSSNNRATQKILDNQGELEELATQDKSTLVGAINEVFQLGSERKSKLVENLTALGVTCSTFDPWEVLLSKMLTIMTGYNTSDANIVASNVLNNKIAYGNNGKIVGSMPNRAVAPTNGGNAESILHPSWPSQSLNHSTLTQYGEYGPSGNTTNKLIMRAPEGYYDSNTRLYANPDEVAKVIGLTADKLVSGNNILGINGTGSGTGVRYVEFCRAKDGNDDSGTHFGYFELLEAGYNAILLEVYRWYNYNPSVDYPIGSLFMYWGDLYDMSGSLSSTASRYIALNANGTSPVRLTLYKEYITATRQNSEYGFRLLGIKDMNRA